MEQLELHNLSDLTPRQSTLLTDLRSWATLQPHITELDSMEEVRWLMVAEQAGKNRIRILERLLSRFNKLRLEHDRRQLSKGVLPS